MPELVFFVGKGGVGKTTVSSAYAVRAAASRPAQRVLLISTDPAHSLSDVLETKLGHSPKALNIGARTWLTVWEIDSEKLFRDFINQRRRELVKAVESGSLFTADEVSALLDTALPGMSEMGALLAIRDVLNAGKYETVVVDTAPFGHTLRLFALPEQFSKLLNFLELSAERDQVLAQHFGGTPGKHQNGFIAEWRRDLEELKRALAKSKLFLVTTAEPFALAESERCIEALRDADPLRALSGIVLNRVMAGPTKCAICREDVKRSQQAQKRLQAHYKRVPLYVGDDPGLPIIGTEALRTFADSVFGKKKVRPAARGSSTKLPRLGLTRADWPDLKSPLTFVLGKGGVGKTTVSAALGVRSRQRSRDEVQICSVDPAPSLDDIFQTAVTAEPRPVLGDKGLCASELDAVALYKNWVAEMRSEIDSATSVQSSGVQIDLSYERRLFSELLEIVPPGLDEVIAIFRIIDLAQGSSQKVVIDMAPTGHALELLRTPERILVWSRLLLKSLASHRKLALAREAAVRIAEMEVRARELSRALTGSGAKVFAVMLPEPLPDRETERLLGELRKLHIAPEAIFVNRVILGPTNDCARCRNAQVWQAKVLRGLKKRLGVKTVFLIPALKQGPAGKSGLRELTEQLWALA